MNKDVRRAFRFMAGAVQQPRGEVAEIETAMISFFADSRVDNANLQLMLAQGGLSTARKEYAAALQNPALSADPIYMSSVKTALLSATQQLEAVQKQVTLANTVAKEMHDKQAAAAATTAEEERQLQREADAIRERNAAGRGGRGRGRAGPSAGGAAPRTHAAGPAHVLLTFHRVQEQVKGALVHSEVPVVLLVLHPRGEVWPRVAHSPVEG